LMLSPSRMGKSLKRFASSASYSSMRRDSAQFALIRLIVDQPEKAIDLLKENDYLFDSKEVVAIDITNKPGEFTKITKKFGEEGININYVYGSVSDSEKQPFSGFPPNGCFFPLGQDSQKNDVIKAFSCL